MQHLLSPDEVLLTFIVGDKKSFLWVIRPDLEKFFTLPAREDELTRTITQMRKSLNPESTLRSFDLEKAQDLYDLLIKPVESYVKGSDHLLIVPNGPLESLPMGLLVKQLDRKFHFKNLKSGIKIREELRLLVLEESSLRRVLEMSNPAQRKRRETNPLPWNPEDLKELL